MDYAVFVKKVRDYRKEYDFLEAAVNRAIDECIKENRLREFLEQHRAEVVEIMLDSYSLENYQKIVEYEKEHMEQENQQLKSANQELKGTVESMKNTMNEIESEKQTLQNEKQTLQTQNKTLQNELNKNIHEKILSMIQMALEFGADEDAAIHKTAEKCNMSEEDITQLWKSH